MLAPGSSPQPVAVQADDQVPGNELLLARLERAAARLGSEFSPHQVVPSRDDLQYFVSRAASLLVHPRWEQRNLGVKLLGLLHARDRTPLLLALLRDRRPAPLVKRLLGGDFVQVGFIRRNIVAALARLGQVTPEVEAALVDAFHDPYYEVRAEAARTVSALSDFLLDRTAVVAGLISLLQDRWLEVAVAGAEALGRVGSRHDALPALLAMQDARYWVVRAAALRGLLSLVERGEGGDPAPLLAQVNHFVLTSTDFKPEFQIKRLYGRLLDAIEGREREDQ
jgi:UDP-N-acetylglucosamine--N-acetylmuramyl-(pentapeptide) pyrophosphoryl-undecaprenol N-acetylglucosamine transferase